jgi:hypothetical protein
METTPSLIRENQPATDWIQLLFLLSSQQILLEKLFGLDESGFWLRDHARSLIIVPLVKLSRWKFWILRVRGSILSTGLSGSST